MWSVERVIFLDSRALSVNLAPRSFKQCRPARQKIQSRIYFSISRSNFSRQTRPRGSDAAFRGAQ